MANRKPTIQKEKTPISQDTYYDLFTGEQCWWPVKTLEAIARELIEYCRTNQRALSIEKFRIHKGIPSDTWWSWEERYPFFKKAHKEAIAILANKRYEMAAFREVDKDVIFRDQYRFDPKAGEDDQRKAELKNQETANTPPTVIYLPATPQTGIESQPEKKERIAAERRAKANS